MFSLSAPEAAVVLLYVVGVMAALYVFLDARGIRSGVVLLCALTLPVLGSAIAVVLAAVKLRNRRAGSCSGGGSA